MNILNEQKLQLMLDEIFWGDYRIDVQLVKHKITDNDQDFLRFLVGRIVTHSLSPACRLLSLFPEKQALDLLASIRTTGGAERRRTLAQAVIAQTIWEVEPKWQRSPIS